LYALIYYPIYLHPPNDIQTALLDFSTPHGLRLNISSLPTPNIATSYTLSTTGFVDGSLSYLYSSLPLHIPSSSQSLSLHSLIRGYRHINPPRAPEEDYLWEIWHRGMRVDRRDVLMYGRMFLPSNALEALYLRRVNPRRCFQIRAVSDRSLPNGGSVLGLVQNDHGKFSTEYLYSTDSGLLGVRGLYNFGPDPRDKTNRPLSLESEVDENHNSLVPTQTNAGLFSAGAELYYGLLNKSGGISTGLRFTTLPAHTSFPYTMTLTLNPLMGNLSSTYSVKAGQNIALSSRFDFNFYSYESSVLVGCELWRMSKGNGLFSAKSSERSSETVSEFTGVEKSSLITETPTNSSRFTRRDEQNDDDITGVLKARVDQNWRIGLLWEGRFKELLFSIGASLDLKRKEHVLGGLGLEVSYSS
jgi:distribution and morphology protein 10